MSRSKYKKIASLLSPYIHEIYLTKKIEVHLTYKQVTRARIILFNLTKMWNQYCEETKNSLDNGTGFIHRYDFDKNYYPLLRANNPEYYNVPSQARTDMFMNCWRCIRYHWVDPDTRDYKIPFRSWEHNPITSYHFQKDGLRFSCKSDGKIDTSHFWIPILHDIKLKESGYLNPDDVQYITSGRVCYDKLFDKWYICFKLQVDTAYFIRHKPKSIKSAPIGIDLGVHHLITVASENGDLYHLSYFNGSSPVFDSKVKYYYNKIERIHSIIGYKVNQNLRKYGYDPSDGFVKVQPIHFKKIYHTKNIDKLWDRIRKYNRKIKMYVEDIIKKMISSLALLNPEFIGIENLDINWMRTHNQRWLNKNLRHSFMGFTRAWMIWKFRDCYRIPVAEADITFPSSKLCSHCGSRNEIAGNDDIYICKSCGININRDYNAAINLLNYAKSVYNKCIHIDPAFTVSDLSNSFIQ